MVAIMYFSGFLVLGFNIVQAMFYQKGFHYKISGTTLNNHKNEGMMYMAFNESDSPFNNFWVVDSTKIVNGKFEFEGSTYYPVQTYLSTEMEALYYRSAEKTSVIYIEPKKEIKCIIDLEHPFDNIIVYNSPTFEDYRYLVEKMKPMDERRVNLWHKRDSIINIGDTVQTAKLSEELVKLNWDYTSEYLNAVYSLNKNSAVAFDGYVAILICQEYLTSEQLREIEYHFMQVPEYIRNCYSGRRVSKMIEYTEKNFKMKNRKKK